MHTHTLTSGLASIIWRTAGLAWSMVRMSSGLRRIACTAGGEGGGGAGRVEEREHLGWREQAAWLPQGAEE